jgi:myosin heavy subunit
LQLLELQKNCSDYKNLQISGEYNAEGQNDEKDFKEINEIMDIFFTLKEKATVFRVLAAILLLSNLNFTDDTFTNASPCSITDPVLF